MARTNPLLFTKDGELATGQVILIACCLVGMVMFVVDSVSVGVTVSTAAWAWFGSYTTMCFIAGAAVDRARLISASGLPSAVASGISQASGMMWPDHLPDDGIRPPSTMDATDE